MTPSFVSILLASTLIGSTIQGTVRMSGSGEPLGGVSVEVDDGVATAFSDSTGGYELFPVTPGPHRLRFRRLGCAPMTVEVLVPMDGHLHLDVELLPGPVALAGIEAVPRRAMGDPDPDSKDSRAFPEIGFQRVTMDELRANSLSGEADVFRGIAGSPGVAVTEFSNTPHVRGGSGDQILTLIDGVPIYSPYHSTDVLGAVNPDAMASVEAHTAVPSARFGGRLSGVIDLQPRDPSRHAVEWSGRAGMTAVGQTVDGPLPFHLGGFVVSARRSYRDLFETSAGDPALRFEDRFGNLTLALPHGTVRLLLFQSVNRLAFDGQVDSSPAAGATSDTGVNPRNRFGSASETEAVIWRDTIGPAEWETKAWHADLQSAIVWGIAGLPTRLTSSLTEDGVATMMTRPWSAGSLSVGVSLERPQAAYDLRSPTRADSSAPLAPIAFGSARTIVAAFVEGQWVLARRWAASSGVRADMTEGVTLELEPRLSLRFAASPRVAVSVGYARTVQYVQSLRNEESVLDVIFGTDLLVGAGGPAGPAAHADQVTGSVELHVHPATRLMIDAFAKRFDGLALIAPETAQPFATARPMAGTGAARGADIAFQHDGARLGIRVAYALSLVTRRADQLAYHPAFVPRHTLRASVGYRLGSSATLGASMLGAAGHRTTPIDDAFQGRPYDPLRGIGDFSGSPQHWSGPVDGTLLPAYFRLDVSVRRDWHPGWLGSAGALSTIGAVDNVLGSHNTLAYVVAPGTRQTLFLLPLTLSFGVEWRH